MCRKQSCFGMRKRAVCAGLFLGVLFGLTACTKPVVQPGITDTPVPSPTEEILPTQEPLQPTEGPDVPQGPTEKPEVPVTAGPTITPDAAPTGEPDPTEGPDVSPSPTATAESDAELTETPEPTGQPAYETLLQNGWQRTGDFFGCREIFFSGKFDCSELIAEPGRYEYRFTSSDEPGVSFSVIGEEELELQPYLEEIAKNSLECHIERETEGDYRYLYTDGETMVSGRIYTCDRDGKTGLMRVEFRTAAREDLSTEGYEFYLR